MSKTIKKLKPSKWFIVVLIAILIVLGGILYIIVQNKHNYISIDNMQSYSDPAGYFTIDIPKTWKIKAGVGKTINNTQITENVSVYPTTSEKGLGGNMGITIEVYGWKTSCDVIQNKNNITLDGIPAYFDSIHGQLWLNTTTAVFSIYRSYPGGAEVYDGTNMQVGQTASTSIPHTRINADEQIINQIINSFKPKNTQGLKC